VGREIRLRPTSGEQRWAVVAVSAVGAPDSLGNQELIVQFDDITARKSAEDALSERALTDSVTGLPNRYAVADRLSTAVARLARTPGHVCVLFCDLDHFKQVNDVFGHHVGDMLLRDVGRRFRSAIRPQDTVGRIGGDEFVVVCEGFDDAAEAASLAVRLQEQLREPWRHGDQEFVPTASIGIAVTADPYASTTDLLRMADVAMYRAKDSGRDRIETYDRSLDEELAETVAVQQQLRHALQGDGLVLHYQPIVDIDDGDPVAVEALVRMKDGDGGLLGPDRFLTHAEASGLIAGVGTWVLRQALHDLAAWRAAGRDIAVSVNVSPTQLMRAGFADQVLALTREYGVPTHRLVVEVTETALVGDDEVVRAALNDLHTAGIRIALDDFGTGYSSLSWLHRFPVDIVKIDRSFVHTLTSDHVRAVVVRAVLDIAAETGLVVVAEGVETEEQRRALVELGCTRAQGWLFGRAVAADDPMWAAAPSDIHAGRERTPSS